LSTRCAAGGATGGAVVLARAARSMMWSAMRAPAQAPIPPDGRIHFPRPLGRATVVTAAKRSAPVLSDPTPPRSQHRVANGGSTARPHSCASFSFREVVGVRYTCARPLTSSLELTMNAVGTRGCESSLPHSRSAPHRHSYDQDLSALRTSPKTFRDRLPRRGGRRLPPCACRIA
jgi:hypothetical protein